jgi:GAF domain-containing protein
MSDLPQTLGDPGKQAMVAATFVGIVDTLVEDFDVIDVLTILASRCVELVAAGAAGILLADASGQLRVMAASSEAIQLLELFQIQNDEGPCLACFAAGQVVFDSDLGPHSKWPTFAAESVRAGYPSVCAVPLRLRDTVLGCLNLFMSERQALSNDDVILVRALADVASIAIAQARATREATIREEHLQYALDSRIVIEQAKGMISERGGVDMDEAFSRLRVFARSRSRRMSDVAGELVDGTLDINLITTANPRRS